jgi:hypothetical protein
MVDGIAHTPDDALEEYRNSASCAQPDAPHPPG